MQQENKEECPYCDINIPLPKHNEEQFQWHLNGHKSAPQTPDSGILAKTIDKVLETCDKETRIDLFSVFMKHVAMNPENIATPDSWEEEFDKQFEEVILDQEVRTVIKGIKHFIRSIASSEYKRGRQSIIDEMNHGQQKMLDGFSHPKDCKMCLLAITDEK